MPKPRVCGFKSRLRHQKETKETVAKPREPRRLSFWYIGGAASATHMRKGTVTFLILSIDGAIMVIGYIMRKSDRPFSHALRMVMSKPALLSKPPVSERMRSIKRVLWAVLFLNLAVAAAKYIYGSISGSASMQADGIHSVFDSAGNVVGLIGIAIASRPADESHPYGHAKFETYASLVIGILLLLAAIEVGGSAIQKLVSQNYSAEVTPMSFIVMAVTLLINIGVTRYERKRARELNSEVLRADASHTLSDALVSVGVIIGLVLVALGVAPADPIMALVVTVAILFTAYDVFRHGFATLSDRSRIPEDELRDFALSIPQVKNAHRIRTRGTEGEVYVDLHILVDPAMTVVAAHELSTEVEESIKRHFPHVIEVLVHIEPDDGHVDD